MDTNVLKLIIILSTACMVYNFNYVNYSGVNDCKEYNKYPFQHCIIDDFLNNNVLEPLLNEIYSLNDGYANKVYNDKNNKFEYNKFAFNAIDSYLYLKYLFIELNNIEFIRRIEAITGITNIITNDITLNGAGIHRVKSNGYLKLHTDFSGYVNDDNIRLRRRVNLLIYMNENWKDEYNGHLWLCNIDEMSCIDNISPILNRAVIFSTTDVSIHGHPVPLNSPNNIQRHSIAVYYYTKETNGEDAIKSTVWYEEKEFNNHLLIKIPFKVDSEMNKNLKIVEMQIFKNDDIRSRLNLECTEQDINDIECQKLISYCDSMILQENLEFQNNEDKHILQRGYRTIWIFWYQGIDYAPPVVKRAIQSWKTHHQNNWDIMVLDKYNMQFFVNFHDLHISKRKLDTISRTDLVLLSDLLRVLLLYKYGGVWVDATVYAHRSLDSWLYHIDDDNSSIISNHTFFGFRSQIVTTEFNLEAFICGWFIAVNTQNNENYIMKSIFEAVKKYWYKRVPIKYDYYWLHSIIDKCMTEDEKFRGIFHEGVMPADSSVLTKYFNISDAIRPFFVYPNVETIFQAAHLIQLKLLDEIDDKMKHFIDNTLIPVSKLTYKYDQTKSIKNTVLQYLLNKS